MSSKFAFKTTIERNGIMLTRPCAKIPKTSRDSYFKIARSKQRSKMRGHSELPEEPSVSNRPLRTKTHYVPCIIEPEFDVPIAHWPYAAPLAAPLASANNQSFAIIAKYWRH